MRKINADLIIRVVLLWLALAVLYVLVRTGTLPI